MATKKVTTNDFPAIRLLADRVLVKIETPKEITTTGGIIIPTANTEEKPMQGIVVAVSARVQAAKETVDRVLVGETVILSRYAGSDIRLGLQDYKVVRISDIFGALTPEKK